MPDDWDGGMPPVPTNHETKIIQHQRPTSWALFLALSHAHYTTKMWRPHDHKHLIILKKESSFSEKSTNNQLSPWEMKMREL
jgi:hypothetical protein